jgi:hypothetical protein
MSGDLTEFRPAPGCRKTDPMHMAVDVEVAVLHPDGMIEVQESVGQFLPERRYRPDPRRELVTETVVAVTAGNRRGIQFQHRKHLQGLRCGLKVEHAGVESAQPLRT